MSLTRRSLLVGCLGAAALAASGCSGSGTDAPEPGRAGPSGSATAGAGTPYFPPATGSWEPVEAAAAGWDEAALGAAVALAGERSSRSLRVVVDGRVLVARDWGVAPDSTRDVASVQKSVLGLLALMARDRGLLALDDPVTARGGPGWSNAAPRQEEAVTIRHLLTMTSGLDDRLRYEAAPGTAWRYNTTAYHALRPLLERTTSATVQELSQTWLFAPIGARHSAWYQRPGAPDPTGRPLQGLRMSTDDMGRLGLLVQRGGTWDGTEVIARPTLEEAITPSQTLNPAYGLLWWLNGRRAPYRIPGAPDDLVAALGNDDQKIYASRSTGVVVSRLGDRGGSTPPTDPDSFDSAFLTALMAAAPR